MTLTVVEYHTTVTCTSASLTDGWIEMPLVASSQMGGYLAKTSGNIPSDAHCIRVRLASTTNVSFAPGSSLQVAFTAIIPTDANLQDKSLFNRALAGASIQFGSSTDISLIETAIVQTRVSNDVVVETEKSFEVDPARSGWIKWRIRAHNASGTVATTVQLMDDLSDTLIFAGVAEALPSGWVCVNPDCAVSNPNLDGSGGQVHLNITQLSPDDGNPGSGNDEGTVAIWTHLKNEVPAGNIIKNCSTIIPSQGIGDQRCQTSVIAPFNIALRQTISPLRNEDSSVAYPGDTIQYTISLTNPLTRAVYLQIYDVITTGISYLPGSLRINGASASDSFVTNGILHYAPSVPLLPNSTLVVQLTGFIKEFTGAERVLNNQSLITICFDPHNPITCQPAKASNLTSALAKPLPYFVVNSVEDPGDGDCTQSNCTLREAIKASNSTDTLQETIFFTIPGTGPHIIQLTSALVITAPVVVDATSQPGTKCAGRTPTLMVTLDGTKVTSSFGMAITAGRSIVKGLSIQHFGEDGLKLNGIGGNIVTCNAIAENRRNGITVYPTSVTNRIQGNTIFSNSGLGIDLGDDGINHNDILDVDLGANLRQNHPVLIRAILQGSSLQIQGRLDSAKTNTYTIDLYANKICNVSGYGEGEQWLTSLPVTTNLSGTVTVSTTVVFNPQVQGKFVSATATDSTGNTSEFSTCIVATPENNDSWLSATDLRFDPVVSSSATSIQRATADQYLDRQGQARWYKFPVVPGSTVVINLTNLPVNYDVTLHKDFKAISQTLNSPQDLVKLGAEFAPDFYSPDFYSPDFYSPDFYSPDFYSPDFYSPDFYSPDFYSPDFYSPDFYSPDFYSPDFYSPDFYSPDFYSPDPHHEFTPTTFSNVQMRTMVAASTLDGTANERIAINTWDNSGDFYIRVRGRNGVFSTAAPFHLEVTRQNENCGALQITTPASSIIPSHGNLQTIILTDWSRVPKQGIDELKKALEEFAKRPEIAGEIVDIGLDEKIQKLWQQADADINRNCPFAMNLIAQSIKSVVDSYRTINPTLTYVVIVGNDNVIPFFRHPDNSYLASEKNYVPPVRDDTTSQASLKLGYVLSQDFYGASIGLSLGTNAFPIPDLAVGRLVETPADIIASITAYSQTASGVAPQPKNAFVSGYEFLQDGANSVADEFAAGLGSSGVVTKLITSRRCSPQDTKCDIWNAQQVRENFLKQPRYDLVYLAGHFSAHSMLAADYRTRIEASEVASSTVDLKNAIIFSSGCHAGYNIVNEHGVPKVTAEVDWPQAFARKGAILIAGTGYQYGDTDFVEYSERLYYEFSRQLRNGPGDVAVGEALVAAKKAYLSSIATMRPLHEKSLLQATLFGLPMLKVNLTVDPDTPQPDSSIVNITTPYSSNPGAALGLIYADVTITPEITLATIVTTERLTITKTTSYFSSTRNGVVSNPGEPTLPLELYNVKVSNMVLRGVGFRSGMFKDNENILPLSGAPTTEIRGTHRAFYADTFYPARPWGINYFDVLSDPDTGVTRLSVTPAQYKSREPNSETGTLRQFERMQFRLYYSNYTTIFTNTGNAPALAAAPLIASINALAQDGRVKFQVQVVGDPAAGIQEVWVTFVSVNNTFPKEWSSLDLKQNDSDSRLWEGELPLNGMPAEDLRFMVQAVSGVGLVSLNTNEGSYYSPDIFTSTPLPPPAPIQLRLESPPIIGTYNTSATVNLKLTDANNAPLSDQTVTISLGSQEQQVRTNNHGSASAMLPLIESPGSYEIQATFPGSNEYQSTSFTNTLEITRMVTSLVLSLTNDGQYSDPTAIEPQLRAEDNVPLPEKTVFVVAQGAKLTYTIPIITDYLGYVHLDQLPIPAGHYTITAYFGGVLPITDVLLPGDTYRPITSTGLLSQSPETATVTIYPSNEVTTDQVGKLNFTATVIQADDGNPGQLNFAKVQFDITQKGTTTVTSTELSADVQGQISATILGLLPNTTYMISGQIVGGFYASPSDITIANHVLQPSEEGEVTFRTNITDTFTLGYGQTRTFSNLLPTQSYTFTVEPSAGNTLPLTNIGCVAEGEEA